MGKPCNGCGKMIEFRWIDGGPTPLGCECYGGFGYSNSRPRVNRSSAVVRPQAKTIHRLRESDGFCRASRCSICRAVVYFVRHNGGSVWFDELGWPWPKHACFNLPGPSRTHERIASFSNQHRSLQIGLVVEVESAPAGVGGWVVLKCTNGLLRRGCLRDAVTVRSLLGEIVAYSWEVGRLFRLDVGGREGLALAETEDASDSSADSASEIVHYDVLQSEFTDGDLVRHDRFGQGTVLATSYSQGDLVAEVLFETAGLRRLLVKEANLTLWTPPAPEPLRDKHGQEMRVRVYSASAKVLVNRGLAVGKWKSDTSTFWSVIPDGETVSRDFVSPPCVVKRLKPKV